MKSNDKREGAVYVMGLGVRLVAQITLESNFILKQMDHIFHAEDDSRVSEYIQSLGCTEMSLRYLYKEGKSRELAYQEMCDAIITSANEGLKCAYLTAGNPTFLNTVVFKLRESTAREQIPFFAYSGVSSIDALITDLSIPMEVTGLQCYEATHFVRMRPMIDKQVPLVLFQPAVVEAFEVHYTRGAYLPGVRILRDYLIELYDPNEKWVLLRSGMSNNDSPIISKGILAELVDKARDLEMGTLVIPGGAKLVGVEEND